MEFAALVALGPAEMVLGLAGAELAEVLGRLGDDVGEGLGAVDAGGARAVAVEEVAALDHEVFYLRAGVVLVL